MSISQRFSLPLLTKELIEQAQSKRTYVLRVVYAVALYAVALWYYSDLTGGGTAAELLNLGRGRALFANLILVQLAAILLLVPVLTCGALTVEKEKDTLALLLLTKLSSWTIVFEKLLSRVFAMGTYQLLSLPLFAIIYGVGGVELPGLLIAIVSLVGFTVVVGSISILCSTWFRTTSEAFIMVYIALFCLSYCCSPMLFPIMEVISTSRTQFSQRSNGSIQLIHASFLSGAIATSAMLVCAGLLGIASRVLVSRAFVPPRNILLEQFHRADRFFNALNEKTTGGIVLVSDRETLPLFQPITWRETRKKSLGTFRYQFRILMFLLTPLIFVIASVMNGGGSTDFYSPFRAFPVFFWGVSVICLTIHATGVIQSERIRQSLDVLLVTPLSPSDIVLEKLSGVRRMIKILSVPFAALVTFQAIWTGYVVAGSTLHRSGNFWLELVATSLSALFYMPLIMWVGFQFGLRLRTQMQAVLFAFASVAFACLGPLILAKSYDGALSSVGEPPSLGCAFVFWLSPLQPILGFQGAFPRFEGYASKAMGADPTKSDIGAWLFLLIHFAICGVVWFLLRRNALKVFSKTVGRLEPIAEKTASLMERTSEAS